MKLQKGKWYVCIKSWSDDEWCKFVEGDLLRCEHDDELKDCYGISHLFVEEDLPQIHFREATETERNIANATAIDMDEFMEGVHFFEPTDTLANIYRRGAEEMLRNIVLQLNIKG